MNGKEVFETYESEVRSYWIDHYQYGWYRLY